MQNSGHLRLCQQPRAAHALRSDQNTLFTISLEYKQFGIFIYQALQLLLLTDDVLTLEQSCSVL